MILVGMNLMRHNGHHTQVEGYVILNICTTLENKGDFMDNEKK